MKKHVTIIWLIALLAIAGCTKNQPDTLMPEQPQTSMATAAPETFSGGAKKLENPYSVSNMRKAYQSLAAANRRMNASGADAIKATHRYVKLMPASEEALDLLKQDTTLDLYPYPLDVEFPEGTDLSNYRDAEVPKDQPGYLYASVPVQHKMPQVKHEVLEELFIPDEEKTGDAPEAAARATTVSENIAVIALQGLDPEALVERSLQLTRNEEYADNNTTARSTTGIAPLARRGRWRPAGRITMTDDVLGVIGIEGLEIRARRWFTTHKGITNSNGDYSCNGTFKRPANYSFFWERYDFAVRHRAKVDNTYGQAVPEYRGPKKTGDWNIDIDRNINNLHRFYAIIFRAAYHYYYKDILGLRRPPQNSFWKTQLKLLAENERRDDINGNAAPWRRFLGMGSFIHIYNPQNNSRDIYGISIHELAHASHWNMSKGGDYKNASLIVSESWAMGVEWALTRMVYSGYEPDYYRLSYTGIVQDLVDGVKTRASHFYLPEGKNQRLHELFRQYNDRASGYSLRQIEDALRGSRTIGGWSYSLRQYANPTKQHVNEVLNFWNTK